VNGWSEERMAAVRRLASELAAHAGGPDAGEHLSRLIAQDEPIRDWVIHVAWQAANWDVERTRRASRRTRTSPVSPCEDYDPRAFWMAFERFKAAIAGLVALVGSAGLRTRAAALVAFRGGPLPADLPEWERDLVKLADSALTEVRTALSLPARWGEMRGGKKSLASDLVNLELEIDRFAKRIDDAEVD
jgi:hypothetical protein